MLRVYLFGPPRCERDGEPLHLGRRLTTALNAYLFTVGQAVSRETLATLFWPETDQAAALKNLRRELARLKRDLGGDVVAATRAHLAIDPAADAWVDVAAFRARLGLVRQHAHFPETDCTPCREALAEAVTLYSGDFMAGFNLLHSPEFDSWQRYQQETLRDGLAQALRRLATWHAARRHDDRAIHYARRWLALDPLDEAARHMLMQIYVGAGQQAAALRLYDEGARLLREELGIEPAAATTALWQAIRDGRAPQLAPGPQLAPAPQPAPGPQPAPVSQPAPGPPEGGAPRRTNLPRQPTPFIGRENELSMIQLRLQEPACRLLTLVGPGGIGKTRLALEVAARLLRRPLPLFPDGVCFVSLAETRDPDVVPAVLAALRVPPSGGGGPIELLLAVLHRRKMLLVLDNVEHLHGAAALVEQFLCGAPGVRVLCTSRLPLSLQEEWVHPVEGLSVPPREEDPAAEDAARAARRARTYDAVRLFENRARAVTPAFQLEREIDQVVRICRLVEGMPLALELAGAWLRVMDTQAVADELEAGIDLLASRYANTPPRHQSIRAVFEQTWARLLPAEREVLTKLSVCRGGFNRDAASSIAGATLPILSSLVEKSMLVVTGTRRYRLHELLRQFAAEKLTAMGLADAVRKAHSDYYLGQMAAHVPDLKGAEQQRTLAHIKDDLGNMRHAWAWALEEGGAAVLDAALDGVFLYFSVGGRTHDGTEFLRSAARCYAPPPGESPGRLWARITARLAMLVGYRRHDAALNDEMEAALAVAEQHGDTAEIAFCLLAHGFLHTLYDGDPAFAVMCLQRALSLYRTLDDPYYEMQVLIWLGFAYSNTPDLDSFFVYMNQALAIGRAGQYRAGLAQALSILGGGAFVVGDYHAAEQYVEEVHRLALELEALGSLTHTKTQLSLIALLKGELERAAQFAADGHALAREISHPLYTRTYLSLHASLTENYAEGLRLGRLTLDIPMPRFGVVKAHWAVAIAYAGLGEKHAARRHTLAMLELARESGFVGILTWALPVLAVIEAQSGDAVRAVELLSLAQNHPLSPTGWQDAWPLLRNVRCQLEGALGSAGYDAAWGRGAQLDLDETVGAILCAEAAPAVEC